MHTISFFLRSSAFKIFVFLAGTFILGAIIAPYLFWGGKHVVSQGWLHDGPLQGLSESMGRAKFPRFFNRSVLIAALILLWPTLKWLDAGGATKKKPMLEALMLQRNPLWWKEGIIGFTIGATGLLGLGWLYVTMGWYVPRDLTKALYSIILSALITGLAVGFLEEFIFRGAFHAVFAKLLKPVLLFFAVAAFYALIHFFNVPKSIAVPETTAMTGFWMLGAMLDHFLSQFSNFYFLFAEFSVLIAVGFVLGYTRMKTKSLWLGIGLHAGWVFGIKMLSSTTTRAFDPSEMMPWLGETLRMGAASTIVVGLTGMGIVLWLRNRPSPAAA